VDNSIYSLSKAKEASTLTNIIVLLLVKYKKKDAADMKTEYERPSNSASF
jgi:hypothetical protein